MKAEQRFVEWYQAEHGRVLSTLTLATRDREVAREATDEAFARALERWHRVGQMESPTGWTYQVALNVARRRLRRRSVERTLLGHRAVPGLVEQQPVDHELWAAVSQLPPRQRTAVALRYVADLPEARIAEAMQVAPGTVSATLNAARTRLAAMLAAAQPQQGVHHD